MQFKLKASRLPTEEHQNTGYCDLEIIKKILLGDILQHLFDYVLGAKYAHFFLFVLIIRFTQFGVDLPGSGSAFGLCVGSGSVKEK